MKKARIAVLLVSNRFLNSNFVRNDELPELLQSAIDEEAEIIWIPVTASKVDDVRIIGKNGTEIVISQLQALFDPKKPLRSMETHEREVVYNSVYDMVKEAFVLSE